MSVAESSRTEAALRRSPYAEAPRLPQGSALGVVDILGQEARERELELEIGPGRGGFIVERLAAAPDVCIVGLEIRLKWASLLDERVRELGFAGRARVFAEDIRGALPRFSAGSLARIFIHFPDPWWKKRHRKRRVMNEAFLGDVVRTLAPGGSFHFWTDVEEYFQFGLALVAQHTPLAGPLPVAESPAEHDLDFRTHFERRMRLAELPVYRSEFRKPRLSFPTGGPLPSTRSGRC